MKIECRKKVQSYKVTVTKWQRKYNSSILASLRLEQAVDAFKKLKAEALSLRLPLLAVFDPSVFALCEKTCFIIVPE